MVNDRVHRNRGKPGLQPRIVADPALTVAPKLPRSLEEQQAALNLLQLSHHQGDGVAQLVQAMVVSCVPLLWPHPMYHPANDPATLVRGKPNCRLHDSTK
jgi:hypothetical protein